VILGGMDILKMLAKLRAERKQIEDAISTIERFSLGSRGKRRGRPPKPISAVEDDAVTAATFSTKRAVSARARKQITGDQKKRSPAKKA
jgi:hypothetical protein